MKAFQNCAAVLAMGLATASAQDFDSDLSLAGSEARTFFVNFTSSLIQVNATLLAAALVIAAIIGAAAVAIYYLWLESQNQSSSSGYGYGSSNSYGYQYAR
jgi:hypothetical protein